ncbi:hypothetical protein ABE29_19515 [Cytobacillus firmus]|nr:hypothetical protein [Cytobacillus firmus]MBG9554175.1 hypothetical protein [Cytobacillus firmus]MBG9576663.1 hypothetical protein [Cytobacillus firmus]
MPFNLNKQELEELRTQKGGNLQLESEPGATSDTKRRMPAVRVRTLSNFGHKKEDACSQSQNPVQLRTQKGGNRLSPYNCVKRKSHFIHSWQHCFLPQKN